MKWLALVLAAGCAGRMGEIVTDPGELSDAGSPKISDISELGGQDVLLTSDLTPPPPGDGVATVGEALWVRGSGFGRRPTVSIAGRPVAVLARTADGGLVVRVPVLAPPGAQQLTVTNDRGGTAIELVIRRLIAALPSQGGRLALLDLGVDGPRAAGDIPAVGQMLRVGADGRAAYVLDAAIGRMTVFELPAQRGPRAVFTLELNQKDVLDPVVAFAASAQASALLIARARELLLLDATSALRPVRSQPRPLPAVVQKAGVAAAALAADGRTAALAVEDGNRIVLVDLGKPGIASVAAELPVKDEARVPVIVDLAFAPDGHTLWVLLGDTAKSRAVGPQSTEIVAVRIERAAVAGAAPVMSIARRVRIEEAKSPVRLNTGRALPLASGASIRLPPERATVYLTALGPSGVATVFRLGAEDRATSFVEVPGVAGAADLSPDGRWLLVPVVQPTGHLAIVAVPADDRPGERRTVDLGASSAGATAVGHATRLPSVAAQP